MSAEEIDDVDLDIALSAEEQEPKPARKSPLSEPMFLDEDEDGNLSF